MRVKVFRAPTIQEALDQVREELGPDAILLDNKKVKDTSGQEMVEISAAMETDGPRDEQTNAASPSRPTAFHAFIEEDIHEIKSMLSLLLSSKDLFSRLQLQEPLAQLYHHFLAKGLEEKNTFLLLRRTLGSLDGQGLGKRQLLDALRRQLSDKIGINDPFLDVRSSSAMAPPVYTFVGPTGVGKTTTLAKLAAWLKLRLNRQVGLITLDTYRIGATEQLKTYAEILGVPFKVVESGPEFIQARVKMDRCDLLLVDTIGKNYLESSHIMDLLEIFHGSESVHHLLILSATSKNEDLRYIIHRFRPLNIGSLIFTKIDETVTPASIVNQLLRFSYPVSFFGTGQRVPEDLEPATHERLCGFLFPRDNDSDGRNTYGPSGGTPKEMARA